MAKKIKGIETDFTVKTDSFDSAVAKVKKGENEVKGAFDRMGTAAQKAFSFDVLTNTFSKIKGYIGDVINFGQDLIGSFTRSENAVKGLSAVVKNKLGEDAIPAAKKAMAELMETGLMNQAEASGAIKNLVSYGFSIKQTTALLKGMLDQSVTSRQMHYGIGEAALVASEGIRNENSVLSDATGTSKNLSNMLKEAGLQMGNITTASQKAAARQAIYNGFMKEAAQFQGHAAQAAKEYQGASAKLGVEIDKLKQVFGKILAINVAPWFADVAKNIRELTDWARKALDPVGALFDKLDQYSTKAQKVTELTKLLREKQRELVEIELQAGNDLDNPLSMARSNWESVKNEILKIQNEITRIGTKGSAAIKSHTNHINNLGLKWKEIIKMVQDYLKDESLYGQLKAINDQYDKIMKSLGNEKALELMGELNEARLRRLQKTSETAWNEIRKITDPSVFADIELKYQKLNENLFAIWSQNDKKKFDLAEERRKLNEAKELEKAQFVADRTVEVMQGAANAIQAIQENKMGNFISSIGMIAGAAGAKWGALAVTIGSGVSILESLFNKHSKVNDQIDRQIEIQKEVNKLQKDSLNQMDEVLTKQTHINSLKHGYNTIEAARADITSAQTRLTQARGRGGFFSDLVGKSQIQLEELGQFIPEDELLMNSARTMIDGLYAKGSDLKPADIDNVISQINLIKSKITTTEYVNQLNKTIGRLNDAKAALQINIAFYGFGSLGTGVTSDLKIQEYKENIQTVLNMQSTLENAQRSVASFTQAEFVAQGGTSLAGATISARDQARLKEITDIENQIKLLDAQVAVGRIDQGNYEYEKMMKLKELKGKYETDSLEQLAVEKRIRDFFKSISYVPPTVATTTTAAPIETAPTEIDKLRGFKNEALAGFTTEELQTFQGGQTRKTELADKLSILQRLKNNLMDFVFPTSLTGEDLTQAQNAKNEALLWTYENIAKITEDMKGITVTNVINNNVSNLNYRDQGTYMDIRQAVEERIAPNLQRLAEMQHRTIFARK